MNAFALPAALLVDSLPQWKPPSPETAQTTAPFTNFLESFTAADLPEQELAPEHPPAAAQTKPDLKPREGRQPVDAALPFAPILTLYFPTKVAKPHLAPAPQDVAAPQSPTMAAPDASQPAAEQATLSSVRQPSGPAPQPAAAPIRRQEETPLPTAQAAPLGKVQEQAAAPPSTNAMPQLRLPVTLQSRTVARVSDLHVAPPLRSTTPASCVEPPVTAAELKTPPAERQNQPAAPPQLPVSADSTEPSRVQAAIPTLPPTATVTPEQTAPATPAQTAQATPLRLAAVAREDWPAQPHPPVASPSRSQADLAPSPPEKLRHSPSVNHQDLPSPSRPDEIATSLASAASVASHPMPGAGQMPSAPRQSDPPVAPPDSLRAPAPSPQPSADSNPPVRPGRIERAARRDQVTPPRQSPPGAGRMQLPVAPRSAVLPIVAPPADGSLPPAATAARPVRTARVAAQDTAPASGPPAQSTTPTTQDQPYLPAPVAPAAPQARSTVHAANETAALSTNPGRTASREVATPPPAPRSLAQASNTEPGKHESGANPQPSGAAIVQDGPADSAPPAETAFLAHLTPATERMPEAAPQDRTAPTAPHPVMTHPVAPEIPSAALPTNKQPASSSSPEPEPARRVPKGAPVAEEHPRKAEAPAATAGNPPAETAVKTTSQPLTAPEARPTGRTPESPRVEAIPAARVQAAAPLPEPVSNPAGSKNVEMHFSVDEGRVQVHVAERAGEVRVAVHTPDANLAGALREELPQLTSRLEQTGFHAETWHAPSGGPAESMRAGEPAPGSPQQDTPDAQQRNSGGQQNEQQQRHQPQEEEAAARPGREDFSWLFDAIRIHE